MEDSGIGISFWGVVLRPNIPFKYHSQSESNEQGAHVLHVTHASCASETKGRIAVYARCDGKRFVVCVLNDHQPSSPLELIFPAAKSIEFEAEGHTEIHLTGYESRVDVTDEFEFIENTPAENNKASESKQELVKGASPKLSPSKKAIMDTTMAVDDDDEDDDDDYDEDNDDDDDDDDDEDDDDYDEDNDAVGDDDDEYVDDDDSDAPDNKNLFFQQLKKRDSEAQQLAKKKVTTASALSPKSSPIKSPKSSPIKSPKKAPKKRKLLDQAADTPKKPKIAPRLTQSERKPAKSSMTPHCELCNRQFVTESALAQHNSAKHSK